MTGAVRGCARFWLLTHKQHHVTAGWCIRQAVGKYTGIGTLIKIPTQYRTRHEHHPTVGPGDAVFTIGDACGVVFAMEIAGYFLAFGQPNKVRARHMADHIIMRAMAGSWVYHPIFGNNWIVVCFLPCTSQVIRPGKANTAWSVMWAISQEPFGRCVRQDLRGV